MTCQIFNFETFSVNTLIYFSELPEKPKTASMQSRNRNHDF